MASCLASLFHIERHLIDAKIYFEKQNREELSGKVEFQLLFSRFFEHKPSFDLLQCCYNLLFLIISLFKNLDFGFLIIRY